MVCNEHWPRKQLAVSSHKNNSRVVSSHLYMSTPIILCQRPQCQRRVHRAILRKQRSEHIPSPHRNHAVLSPRKPGVGSLVPNCLKRPHKQLGVIGSAGSGNSAPRVLSQLHLLETHDVGSTVQQLLDERGEASGEWHRGITVVFCDVLGEDVPGLTHGHADTQTRT
jgi:hypothetical protein